MSDSAAGLDMRSRALSGQQPYSTSSPGQQNADAYGNQTAANRLNSFNLYGHRPSGATPPAGPSHVPNSSYFGHLQDSYAYTHPAGRHASFSGASNVPLSPSAAAAGYGKNKAWQMEQLSFLEAQASRGQQQYGSANPHQAGFQHDHNRRSSTSVIGHVGPYDNLFFQTPPHQQAQQQQQQQQQHMAQQQNRPPFYPGSEEGHTGLAMLGAQFPSSHNFGSMQNAGQQAHQQQGMGGAAGGLGGGFSAQALAMLNGDAGLGAASAMSGGSGTDADGAGGNSTPKGRTSRTPTANNEAGVGKAARGPAAAWAAAASASPSGSAGAIGTKRTSTGAPKTAPTQGSTLNSGPSGAVIRALGDLANLDLDLEGALRMLPSHLHPYFTPARLEKRTQPHLDMLRQQHIENGLIDPSTGLEIKPEPTEEDLKREAEEAEKEKKQHTLLTTEEKKANHIASEQKRRANIRKGYELLCDIVPSLREALEREASSKTKTRDDDDSGSDDGSDDEDKKSGSKSPFKKKKGAGAAGKKGDNDGGIEIDGEKIDGRAGLRSEAVVLMKSLDHIGALVEQYRGLLGRRNRARLAVAKKFGWTDLANQPVPDIDRLLAIKVQEWWTAHANDGDEDEDEDEGDDDDEELQFGGAADGSAGADQDEAGGEDGEEDAAEEVKKKASAKGGAAKKSQPKKKKAAAKKEDDNGMHD